MEQEEQHFLKKISGWHYIYVILILVLVIIGLVSYNYSECDSLVALISFAATISSIILSVLAIFMTVLSSESMNKLRDNLIGLASIPSDVNTAVSSTIAVMKKSSEDLNRATEASNENIEKFRQAVDAKMVELESHLSKRLDMHQASTLKAINEANLTNMQGNVLGKETMSDEMIERFISTTSNSSLAFMYIVGRYCENSNKSKVSPIVNLDDVVGIINGGKKDNSLTMYLFACLVLLSSFGLLEYEMQANQYTEVTLLSINEVLIKKIPKEFEKRDLPSPAEGLAQYVDSLFNNNEEDNNDGSEAN